MESLKDKCRKLASIQLIEEILEHPNADSLEILVVLGWRVVNAKNSFKAGDKVVYFEIDSLVPERSWSEFLQNKKYRIKTIRLRGEISQGLCMPLSILEDVLSKEQIEELNIGDDVTEILSVTKYENDADLPVMTNPNSKKKENNPKKEPTNPFPTHLGFAKTDEPRIQSEVRLIKHFGGLPYYATLKYDGTSATYAIDPNNPEEFYICSRNNRRDYDQNDVYCYVADRYKIKDILSGLNNRYAIQGEIFGPKINKNLLGTKDIQFVVFNVYDIQEQKYLDFEDLVNFCGENKLPMVEIVDRGESFNYTMNELKELSKGNYPGTKNPREGLVYRLQKDFWPSYNARYSFKIINDDYLIKN